MNVLAKLSVIAILLPWLWTSLKFTGQKQNVSFLTEANMLVGHCSSQDPETTFVAVTQDQKGRANFWMTLLGSLETRPYKLLKQAINTMRDLKI